MLYRDFYQRVGKVIRAFAHSQFGSFVDSDKGLKKLVFTAYPVDVQHYRDCVENKPVSLHGVSLGKALNGMPLPMKC